MKASKDRRVLVTGSRLWDDKATILMALGAQLGLTRGTLTVVHGGAAGADTIADRWAVQARRAGKPVIVETHPADWNFYGRAAGLIRNQEMVDLGADVCLAFPLGASRGTRHCMKAAADARIPVIKFEPQSAETAEVTQEQIDKQISRWRGVLDYLADR